MEESLVNNLVIDPKAVEESLISEARTPLPEENIDPIAMASGTFGLMYPRFLAHIHRLSKKSMIRLIRALVGVPLEEKLPNWKNEEEKTAYLIGERLMEAKSVIIIDSLYKQQVELEKLRATLPVKEEAVTKEG